MRGDSARIAMVPSTGAGPPGPGMPGVAWPPESATGLRIMNVSPEATPPAGASGSAGGVEALPSVRAVPPVAAAARGSLGSGSCGLPQETRWSCSPPKPAWWAGSAPQADAGSARLPCWESAGKGPWTGSSSKKCGPVSSTEAAAGPSGFAPGGGASDSPSVGAGRLVPGTQEAPFQYRTYPGMDGSG
ncbi:hypothetical protein WKI71_17250 [Streptomyces sp. MS1.AVA.1]|uniref:Uncharacterized protein n=1 Tax=Streptomyces machairae TaxID=3134109 RepID=A0ABU8UKU2_9ACTN